MGILAKLTPGKKKASGAAVAPAATPTIVPGTTAVSYAAVETHAPTATVSDDEPTIFTTFMIVYYGFFGLSLLIHPYVFAASYNPLPYWTSMSDELAFAFRITGGAFLTLVLGPFMDEMFGGVGVVMSAFTRQLVFANTAIFLVFLVRARPPSPSHARRPTPHRPRCSTVCSPRAPLARSSSRA